MFDKLFGRGKKREDLPPGPAISFGRYSDNNKPLAKVNRWTDADNLYKNKNYPESFDAFFEYLRDDTTGNVVYERNGSEGRFELYQGSKIVRGSFDDSNVRAEISLARMAEPSIPVMRRLLEMNFNLYYSRFALDSDRLCMRFDCELQGASPNKLYYGLKELATKGDKQDDILVKDFSNLQPADTEHTEPLTALEKETKYHFLQKWISETLDTISGLDAEKYSGGIAYLLLTLIYRIDYLICPEGTLLNELEKITLIYFKKDERPVPDKNRDMIEELRKMKELPREEINRGLLRSKYTFSIVAPQQYKSVSDSIQGANQNMIWYRDNNYPGIAMQITEYGIMYCQYTYSLPKVITDLIHLYMLVNYSDYFAALGFGRHYYDERKNKFDQFAIVSRIKEIQAPWRDKYPEMDFKYQNLRYDSLVTFDLSFTNEMQYLNMEG